MPEQQTLYDHAALRLAARRILRAAGSGEDEAAVVADHLVEANLLGHDSHGVGMLPTYVNHVLAGFLKPNQHAGQVGGSGAMAIFDGGSGYGQVIAREAAAAGIATALREGVAVFGIRNVHHVGRVGDYGEQATRAGLVSITFVNVVVKTPRVVPYGGIDARLGTNPMCIAIPRSGGEPPVVLDFATSRLATGKVRVAFNEGKPLPEGNLLDGEGNPTTDPAVLFRAPFGGAVAFGDHKGYGLGLMVDILAGAMTGSGTIHPDTPRRGTANGMLTILLRPDAFVERNAFGTDLDALLEWVLSTRPRSADSPVLIPGDPERRSRERRLVEGIPVDAQSWAEIVEAAKAVGVDRLLGE